MPNQQQKSENYSNLGGINVKVSPYITGPFQFLDIVNMDFQTPGSLTKRWGSTQYLMGSGLIYIPQGLVEYIQIDGSSQVVVMGAALAQKIVGFTPTTFRESYLVGLSVFHTGGAGREIQALDGAPATWDFVTYANQLFAANGRNFFRYDGSSSYIYGLPMIDSRDGLCITCQTPGSSGVAVASGGMTGSYYYKFAYVNNRGFVGQGPIATYLDINKTQAWHAQVSVQGASQILININQASGPLEWVGHGITAIAVYRTDPQPVDIASNDIISAIYAKSAAYTFLTIIPYSATLFTDNNIPSGITLFQEYLNRQTVTYIKWSSGPTLIANGETFVPKYLELYSNRLAMAGFSYALSKIWLSEVNEPEAILPQNGFNVNVNDGDVITGLKSYNSHLYIFKKRSFYVFSGDDVASGNLVQVSDQYGCVSNRAICVYNNMLLFVDQKGLVQFNGSNLEIISNPMQKFFDQMGPDTGAVCIFHDKTRNQILISLPQSSGEETTVTLVFDYSINAWSRYDSSAGAQPRQYAKIKGYLSDQKLFAIDSGYHIRYFGPSFFSDIGAGFTTYFKSRFIHPLGESVEHQFRSLYMNFNNEISGNSLGITLGFYTNYGSSNQLQRTMTTAPFQTRTDFGLSAKSLSFDCAAFNASLPFQVHGFALGYRLQRLK